MKEYQKIQVWISTLLIRSGLRDWVCGHGWCFRECTYDHRCHLHQDDK